MVNMKIPSSQSKGVSLVELMITVSVLAILAATGPNILRQVNHFWRMSLARLNVQRNARTSLSTVNRFLRQSTASSVLITQRSGQPPYSWIQFTIDKGTGAALGAYGVYQEGSNLNYMYQGATVTLAADLKYLAFTYPRSDDPGIISVSMTFEESTYGGYSKALQLSIEKVRVMN